MTNGTRAGAAAMAALLVSCTGGGGGAPASVPVDEAEYKILAFNDLGMHCLNPTYDDAVILPPYNTVVAQVVRRGNPPRVVTAGLTLEYRLVGNTYSYGKGTYGQFWDEAGALFGAAGLPHDFGLNLADPTISNGLSGTMAVVGDHFSADGIPAVPMGDDLVWNPYQVAELTLKDGGGAVLARTTATVPTSDELDCARCHGASPFADIRAEHREHHPAATLPTPVLCASCHGSPALGIMTHSGGATTWLSQAVHGFHGALSPDERPACYDCHPGRRTQCSRSLAHTAADGNCVHCHGALPEVAASIAAGRVPWASEPVCVDCHAGVPEVDTGATLYRNATGHGGVRCAGCHGSPHAMIPSRVPSDHAQALQYQGAPLPLGDCGVCHDSSRGDGLGEYDEAHAGVTPEKANACRVCHTVTPSAAQLAEWPHQFGWSTRTIAR